MFVEVIRCSHIAEFKTITIIIVLFLSSSFFFLHSPSVGRFSSRFTFNCILYLFNSRLIDSCREFFHLHRIFLESDIDRLKRRIETLVKSNDEKVISFFSSRKMSHLHTVTNDFLGEKNRRFTKSNNEISINCSFIDIDNKRNSIINFPFG